MLTLLAVLLRVFSNPAGNLFQKQLTARGHHPLLVNFLMYFLLSAVCLAVTVFIPWPALSSSFWMYSVLMGITGTLGNGFLVKALQTGDLSVLGPINAYKSVVGIVAGVILLGEIPNGWGLLGVALIIFGSYFVLDTTAERFSLALLKQPAIQFRIWALILTAVEAVFVKKLILLSSSGIAFVSWCCFGAVFSFILMLIFRLNGKLMTGKMGRVDLLKYGWLIACMGTMQLTTNFVFEHMDVGYALSLFQLSGIVSVFLGYRFFEEQDIRKKLIGSLIMIAGSIVIILLKGD